MGKHKPRSIRIGRIYPNLAAPLLNGQLTDGQAQAGPISLFEKYNVLSYLSDNFEVLHTQSQQWLMEEIKEYITKQKKANQ